MKTNRWLKYSVQINLLLILVFGAFFFLGRQVPCKQLIHYRIGSIDPRFDIAPEEVQKILQAAEKPWEDVARRELFIFDPQGEDVAVNFIYDERQERVQAEHKLNQAGQQTDKEQGAINTSYATKEADYTQRSERYDARVKEYDIRLDRYNREVKHLNMSELVTGEDAKRLNKESVYLDTETAAIETERLAVNALGESLNTLAQKEEKLVKNYNDQVDSFQERFQSDEVFDQGEFGGRELNIYEFRTKPDLELVLTHELGHTLGLDHVENPKSIMYYLMEQQDPNAITLSQEDRAAFRAICAHPAGFTLGNLAEIVGFVRWRAMQVMTAYE